MLNLVDGTVEYSATAPDWKNEPFKYLATNMVFRRISATTFNFGYPDSVEKREWINSRSRVRKATLSSDYYIAIFPTTTAQEKAIHGNIGSVKEADTRTPTRTEYNLIRGSKADGNICWPETFHTVKEGSMVDRMRSTARAFLPSNWKIDLPTSAQWENAARAGTDATQLCYLDGTGFDVLEDDLVAIFEANANWKKGETLSDVRVGQYNPNPWGLYDTIGCIFEVVLDWCRPSGNSVTPTTDVTDPTGMATIESCSNRQARGGRNNKSEKMNNLLPGNSGSGYTEIYELGYRFCIHLKPITKIAD
jgi:formylglycine-generating enzyme required for sulfatase activity